MKQESLPPMKDVYEALEAAAVDLYGFGVVCHGGVSWLAEPDLLDTLLLGLENFWFTEAGSKSLSHEEFREDFFRALYQRSKGKKSPSKIGSDVPLGHEEMRFYQLPQVTRAAVYLRTKKRFSYASLSRVLGIAEPLIREEVERAREFLLGRRLKDFEWEDDF